MSNQPDAARPSSLPCPLCGKPAVAAHAPFCSAACRDRDLLAWLDERYVVPGKVVPDDEEA